MEDVDLTKGRWCFLPRCLLALLIFLVGGGISCESRASDSIERAGDIIQVLIPATGFGSTFYMDDPAGRNQFYVSFLSTVLVTHSLKNLVDKERPQGGNQAFPSGHTSAAFQGASFIQRRYGWGYGFPAYLGASFVGYSRIEARKHDLTDVLFGAAFGTMSNYLFTTTYNSYTVTPTAEPGVYGAVIRFRW